MGEHKRVGVPETSEKVYMHIFCQKHVLTSFKNLNFYTNAASSAQEVCNVCQTPTPFFSANVCWQDSGSLLYPSVTFCTKYIWQVSRTVFLVFLIILVIIISRTIILTDIIRASLEFLSYSTRTSRWTSRTSRTLPRQITGAGTRYEEH